MKQFKITQTTLDAMLVLAGKKDIRYYLNGVYVEFNETLTRVVATDGHKMGIVQNAGKNVESGFLIIPVDAITSLSKKAGLLTITQITATQWKISTHNSEINFTPYDAKYPDYNKVINKIQGTSGVASGYNLDYLNDFEKCGNILAGGKMRVGSRIRIAHNGENGGIVILSGVDNFAGVIMPLRDSITGAGFRFPDALLTPIITPILKPAAETIDA